METFIKLTGTPNIHVYIYMYVFHRHVSCLPVQPARIVIHPSGNGREGWRSQLMKARRKGKVGVKSYHRYPPGLQVPGKQTRIWDFPCEVDRVRERGRWADEEKVRGGQVKRERARGKFLLLLLWRQKCEEEGNGGRREGERIEWSHVRGRMGTNKIDRMSLKRSSSRELLYLMLRVRIEHEITVLSLHISCIPESRRFSSRCNQSDRRIWFRDCFEIKLSTSIELLSLQ